MNINAPGLSPGDHMCLRKEQATNDWVFDCRADYDTCVARATEGAHKFSEFMIVQIVAMATPVREQKWDSLLIRKVTS